MGYTQAFEMLMWGNYTEALTEGYVNGAGMGEFFYIFLIFATIMPVYLKSESYTLTGLVLMVMGSAGIFTKISGIGGSLFGGINFSVLFAIIMAFGFALVLFGLLGRRE